jgi:hypothetical protein
LDKDFLDEPKVQKPSGMLAYNPLLPKLKECGDNLNRRKEVALHKLPVVLLCALQNEKCLHDIRDVSEKFPNLLSEIYGMAMGLRDNKKLKEWTEYESAGYRNFMAGIRNRVMNRGST